MLERIAFLGKPTMFRTEIERDIGVMILPIWVYSCNSFVGEV
jgi:hypothetical protein